MKAETLIADIWKRSYRRTCTKKRLETAYMLSEVRNQYKVILIVTEKQLRYLQYLIHQETKGWKWIPNYGWTFNNRSITFGFYPKNSAVCFPGMGYRTGNYGWIKIKKNYKNLTNSKYIELQKQVDELKNNYDTVS